MKTPKTQEELPAIGKSKLTPAEAARVDAAIAKALEADKDLERARRAICKAQKSKNPQEILKAKKLSAAANAKADKVLAEVKKAVFETVAAVKARENAKPPKRAHPMEKLFLTRNQAMKALSLSSVATFEGLAKAYDLKPKFRSGVRRYYARADVERVLEECTRSNPQKGASYDL